jgi:hypothetical protein
MAIFLIAVSLLFILLLAIAFRNLMCYNDYEEYEEVTTTENFLVSGILYKQYDNGQPYVMDPADGDKVWVNTKDDLYEDGAGRWYDLRG